MAFYFFVASAVVKYFHQEPGSRWVRQLVEAREFPNAPRSHEIFIANISLAEVPAAFAILARTRRIGTAARDSMYDAFLNRVGEDFNLVEVTTELAYGAGELTQKYSLKGYDAVQLAIASDLDQSVRDTNSFLTFVSGDDALLEAARAEGMATENPFDHHELDTAR